MGLQAGTRLGPYEIIAPLGAGGMGEVYRALDTRLGRNIAIKVMPRQVADDPERRERFEREARTVAALNHPNIVMLHSIEEHEGTLFQTMELVEGRTLNACIPRQGMPIAELLSVAIPLTDAVAAAHQRGVTHRDLKPANVMVTSDGRVKVLDFGLAKVHPESPLGDQTTVTSAQVTREGRILGTLAYMSPEQAQGKAVDARSDIFSLGILLYEMATGERPFKGEGVSVLTAILRDTPASISNLRAGLPRDLSRILKRCLAKDPEDRYQTVKDLRNDLRLLQEEGESDHVAPLQAATVTNATPATTIRRWIWWLGGAALAVIAAAATAELGWRRSTPPATASMQPFGAIAMRRLTNAGGASVSAISPDGRYVAHEVGAGDKPSLWLRQISTSSNVQIVAPTEGSFGGLEFTPDGESILYLFYPPNTYGSLFQVPLLGGPPRRFVDDLDSVPTFSPDGSRMAFVRDSGQGTFTVVVAKADGSDQRQLATRPAIDSYTTGRMAWSPDGHDIATFAGYMPLHYSRVVLIDVETGRERPLGDARFDSPGEIAWMPDGRSLVFDAVDRGLFDAVERGPGYNGGGQLWSMSYPEGAVRRITTDVAAYSSLSVTRDGRALAAVQHDSKASLWIAEGRDIGRARPLTSPSSGLDGRGGIDWTLDGQIVYAAKTQGSWDLWMTDAQGGRVSQVTNDPGLELWPRVLPDGRGIVFVARSANEDSARLRAVDTAGSHARDLLPNPIQPSYLQVVGNDVYFRLRGGRPSVNPVQRMALSGGPLVPALADPAVVPPHFVLRSISHDGRYALGTIADPRLAGATLAVLPVEGGRPLRTFPYESERFPPITGGFGWAPGDRAIDVLLFRDGAVNLWRYPLNGTPPRQITTFTTDLIYDFAWSRDGKMLALSRGSESADVVLITAQ